MCFVNQSICAGCNTIIETPTPKEPSDLTPDVFQHGCTGTKVVVEIEHTGAESCSHCYNKRFIAIKMKWERKEEACTNKAKKQGYTATRIESLRESVRQGMKMEIVSLDEEWERMWCDDCF